MDSPTTIKTFKCKSSQEPVFTMTQTPINYRSFGPVLDVSFSSYLKPEESPANGASNIDDVEINVFDAHKYFSEGNDKNANKGGSLADHKNVEPAAQFAVSRLSSVSSVDGYNRNYRTSSSRTTPTASSEASWNSQTGLLTTPPGSIGVSLKHHRADQSIRRGSTGVRWSFCGKCPCSGKKSVQVQEACSEHRGVHIKNKGSHRPGAISGEKISSMSRKTSITDDLLLKQERIPTNLSRVSSESNFPSGIARQQRVSVTSRLSRDATAGFSFPVLSPAIPTKPATEKLKIPTNTSITPLEEPGRDSIEVFQPKDESISRKQMDIQTGLLASVPRGGSRDSRHCHLPGNSIPGLAPIDDDVGSDASSDLFEIDSFSTHTTTTYPMVHKRDSLDDAPTFNARQIAANKGIADSHTRMDLDEPETPSIAPTECYAPSEVSIDWSVTTAEGFERASITSYSMIASEIGNAPRSKHGGEIGYSSNSNGDNDGGKRKGNILLSCRREDAVSVGPRPIKCSPGGPPFPLISISEHVSSRPHKASKPPLAKAHSAALSIAFAT